MADETSTEDQEETKVWNNIIETVTNVAKLVQISTFNKFKLNYLITLNQIPKKTQQTQDSRFSAESLQSKFNLIQKTDAELKIQFKSDLEKLNTLKKQNPNSKIKLMLDAAKSNLKQLYIYQKNKPPKLADLQKSISSAEKIASETKEPSKENKSEKKTT